MARQGFVEMASQNSWSSRTTCRGDQSAQSRRVVLCDHGVPAVKRIPGTKENPGRPFWGCVYYKVQEHCGFFGWADEEQVEKDPKKSRLRMKVISLKSKLKTTEKRLKIVSVVGLVGWVWLLSIWVNKLGATIKHDLMHLK
ncbi:hypothetical protein PIB30_036110 [Stylosanthes scabra]|uniref:GRF-type domain-containing protein n=1 Tax=Stylosanthes scabra TaxID=79078 RepID=A0ABU6VBW3_9FABA|nr:hypothetical protein [Stylosanthes scabra]